MTVDTPAALVVPPVRRDESVRHDAKFSDEVVDLLADIFLQLEGPIVDPMGGVGRIFEVDPEREDVHAIEIEPEFAAAHPLIICGDALDPETWPAGVGDGHAVTSITYGNRFAGAWVAVDCKHCNGKGRKNRKPCDSCNGLGNDRDRRYGYAPSLNRSPSQGSSALWTFGKKWRAFHYRWLRMMAREIFLPGESRLVLNVSNHYRTLPATKTRDKQEVEVDVCGFMLDAAYDAGFQLTEEHEVQTKRMGHGQNRDARAETERVYVFDLLTETEIADRYAAHWS